MRRIFLFFTAGFLLIPCLSQARNNSSCPLRHREQKDCRLEAHGYRLKFGAEKWIINDGTWRAVEPLPVFGPGVEWKKLRVVSLQGRKFVELLLWSEPTEPVGIQSLNWYIYELKGVKADPLLHKVVQKRRPKAPRLKASPIAAGPAAETQRSISAEKEPEFLYEKSDRYELKAVKGAVRWQHKKDSGSL